jgi:cold shock CspA family protein
MIGTLQGPFNSRGFTFITPPSDAGITESVFAHISQLNAGQDARSFVRGSRVEFEIVTVARAGKQSPQAHRIGLATEANHAAPASSIVASGRTGTLKFWAAESFGFLIEDHSSDEFYVNGDSVPGGYLRQGDSVRFDVEQLADGRQRAVNVTLLTWNLTGDPFNDLIDMGNPS